MADELNPSFGNFSIENTSEMSLGNQELLDNFLDDTPPSNTEEVTLIKEKSTTQPKKKEEPKKEEKVKNNEDSNKGLKTFLSDDEGEEEEEEVDPKSKKKEEEEDSEEEGKETVKENNTFSILSKELFNLGVFNKDDEEDEIEIKTPEEFLDRFKQEQKKGAFAEINRFLGQFGPDYQDAFNAIYVKGVDPKSYFTTYNKIENIAGLDLKEENNQIAVIKQYLVDQNFESEDIDGEVERLKNYGDLENVANRYHKVLIKNEAAKLQKMEAESEAKIRQQTEQRNLYVKNITNSLQNKIKTKEFDGIPLNPNLAKDVQDFLVQERYQTKDGEKLTEFDKTILDLKKPENHEKKIKLALLLKIMEKDPTLSTIQKAGLTKKSDGLFADLTRKDKAAKTEKTEKQNSWFS